MSYTANNPNGQATSANSSPIVIASDQSNLPASLFVGTTAIGTRPDGFLRTTLDPSTLLYDSFETLDTTNTWTIGGTILPIGVAGTLTVSAGTLANGTSYAKSIPSFTPSSSAFLQYASILQLEAVAVTGNQRFWGLGAFITPTLTVPIVNGTIFEIDNVTGNLLGSVYSNSIRTQTIALTRPSDAGYHRYSIYYKASKAYFEIDNVTVGSIAFPNPQVGAFSTVVGSVNGATALTTSAVLNSSVIGIADTGKNSTKLADGNFPWRTLKISSVGAMLNQQLKDTGRNQIHYYMLVPVNVLATDTLMSLTGTKSGATVTATTTPALVTTGKTLRITNVSATYIVATATGYGVVRLRFNTGGVVAITSPVSVSVAVGGDAAGTTGSTSAIDLSLSEGIEFASGTGIGVSVQGFAGVTPTNVGLILVSVKGYEY